MKTIPSRWKIWGPMIPLLLIPILSYAQVPELPPVELGIGNREVVWIVMQVHLLFAAFILGAPIFVVLCEFIGMRTKDARYDRLAKEVTKVTSIAYSLTALFGGFAILVLIGLYPEITSYMIRRFFPMVAIIYPLLFIGETVTLYSYWYTWDIWKEKKGRHLAVGILLNLFGLATMFAINAPTSFMNTPPRPLATATLWQAINNYTWMPLNLHRTVGNITFGGFITGLIAAYLYMASKKDEDKAFYDWMGFVGNLIGIAALIVLPLMGYIYALEFYKYDASAGLYLMSDRLSMHWEINGVLTGATFLAGNFYIWLSMKRVEGANRFAPYVKAGFIIILICNAIWMTPRHFWPVMQVPEDLLTKVELPPHLGFLALMQAKNTAAFLTVLVTLINYLLYRRALKTGKIIWGKIDFISQYVLIFLGFTSIWTMAFMGSVRSFARKYFHVYLYIKDTTPESYTPTLAFTTAMATLITWVFFILVSFAIWLALISGMQKKGKEG
ncbi:MAG: cytochrome ubiquinol oxidase subunit I [Nitrospirae bacterium]|nr:cytochrome ubiquinol oxidase subunit I [Nitrospirota bacterium]